MKFDEQNLHWSARQRLIELLGTDCEGQVYSPVGECIDAMRRAYAAKRDRAAESVAYDDTAQPIEDTLQELAAEVPAEEWEKVRHSDDLDGAKRIAELEKALVDSKAELSLHAWALKMATEDEYSYWLKEAERETSEDATQAD